MKFQERIDKDFRAAMKALEGAAEAVTRVRVGRLAYTRISQLVTATATIQQNLDKVLAKAAEIAGATQ